MKYTIEDLAQGRCDVQYEDNLNDLIQVIKTAFPNDLSRPDGSNIYYGQRRGFNHQWVGRDATNLPTQSVKDFLPKQYPRVMWVWDDGDPVNKKRVVFMEKNGKFLAWGGAETIEDSKTEIYVTIWDHAEDIAIVTVSKQQIAEKFGTSVENLQITD